MATPTTLPATFVAGNVLTAAQMNDLRGAFRILQIVEATSTTETSTTSATFVTANISASITPSATSSKVLVYATFSGRQTNNAGTSFFTLFRGTVAGTNLGNGNNGMARMYAGTTMTYDTPVALLKLDSPATTSSQTYTVGMRSDNAANTATANIGNCQATIVLCEVSA